VALSVQCKYKWRCSGLLGFTRRPRPHALPAAAAEMHGETSGGTSGGKAGGMCGGKAGGRMLRGCVIAAQATGATAACCGL
jgi:hypothetical protein